MNRSRGHRLLGGYSLRAPGAHPEQEKAGIYDKQRDEDIGPDGSFFSRFPGEPSLERQKAGSFLLLALLFQFFEGLKNI